MIGFASLCWNFWTLSNSSLPPDVKGPSTPLLLPRHMQRLNACSADAIRSWRDVCKDRVRVNPSDGKSIARALNLPAPLALRNCFRKCRSQNPWLVGNHLGSHTARVAYANGDRFLINCQKRHHRGCVFVFGGYYSWKNVWKET